jgi:Zn-dependent protease with chaperone function
MVTDALDAARGMLPTWSYIVPWCVGPALGSIGFVVTRWAMLRQLRKLPLEPWTERARHAHPARMLGRMARVLGFLSGVFAAVFTWSAGELPGLRALLSLSAAFAGPLLATLIFEARLRELSLRTALRSWLALSLGVFGFLYALALLRTPTVSLSGRAGAIAAIVGFGVSTWIGIGGGLSIARVLGLARPASARVEAAAQRASARLGVRCREVLELDWAQCNAVAFPLQRRIAFAQGALALDDDELEALAAHELGHLDEPWRIKLVRPLSLALVAGAGFCMPSLVAFSFNAVAVILGALLSFVLIARWAGRLGERFADARAKDETGVYARALLHVYAINLVPLVLPRPGLHGHLYDRLVAAGQPPLEPRPAPARMPSIALRLLVAVPMTVPLIFGAALRDVGASTSAEAIWQIALGNDTAWPFARLASDSAGHGDYRAASIFYRAANAQLPSSAFYAAKLANALARDGQCAAAEAALEDARKAPTKNTAPKTISSAAAALAVCWSHQAQDS